MANDKAREWIFMGVHGDGLNNVWPILDGPSFLGIGKKIVLREVLAHESTPEPPATSQLKESGPQLKAEYHNHDKAEVGNIMDMITPEPMRAESVEAAITCAIQMLDTLEHEHFDSEVIGPIQKGIRHVRHHLEGSLLAEPIRAESVEAVPSFDDFWNEWTQCPRCKLSDPVRLAASNAWYRQEQRITDLKASLTPGDAVTKSVQIDRHPEMGERNLIIEQEKRIAELENELREANATCVKVSRLGSVRIAQLEAEVARLKSVDKSN